MLCCLVGIKGAPWCQEMLEGVWRAAWGPRGGLGAAWDHGAGTLVGPGNPQEQALPHPMVPCPQGFPTSLPVPRGYVLTPVTAVSLEPGPDTCPLCTLSLLASAPGLCFIPHIFLCAQHLP